MSLLSANPQAHNRLQLMRLMFLPDTHPRPPTTSS